MRVDDLTLEVRDRNLKRVGQITPTFLNAKATLRWCAVGEWSLTLPGDHPMVEPLLTPGSGIILIGPDGKIDHPAVLSGGEVVSAAWTETIYGTIMSGPTTVPARKRDAENPDGTFTFTGVSDEVHLLDARAFPTPSIADPAAQTTTNDVRSGKTESLLRQYVAYNIASTHAPAGRIRGLRSKIVLGGADQTRGVDAVKSPRFQNLLELLREIVLLDPRIGFRMVQVDDKIEFQVLDSRDRRSVVRFDVANGTLTSEEVQQQGPTLTDAIVAGQGEGVERTIVRRRDADAIAAEATWGRVIENFIDQRDTDDLIELQQSGDEALAEGRGGTSVKVIPADDTTMQFGLDWRQGDLVSIVVNEVESSAAVTETALLMTSDGVRAGAALGDVSSHTAGDTLGAKVDALDARVALLERTGGIADRLNGKQISDWDAIREPGFYWANNAANAPYPGMVMAQAIVDGANRIVVEAVDPANIANGRARRVFNGSTWAAWVVTELSMPLPKAYINTGTSPSTLPATTGWSAIAGGGLRLEWPAYSRDLIVDVEVGALGVTNTGYWMIGVSIFNAPGGPTWSLPVENADASLYEGSPESLLYGIVAPFSQSTQQVQLVSMKRVRVPAGVPAIFQASARKSVSSASVTFNYANISVTPVRWA